ncbi:hypothetical protein ENSA5_00920 [Enhygromyxa salina]|uniref:Smf/DprA SLOG domain-containing protein n=1 Tax=Enhygromyxa salina TaxID=215803 RepID=A0A2S9YL56_9BACT|nr:DNA-processing protein DprA [Enhygromyxa salina]PRQ05772.1 hypothetical protein ENSA5_00920 [Enhygromyxa salina]
MKKIIDPSTWASTSLSGVQLGLFGPSAGPLELVGPLPAGPRLAIVGSRAAHGRVLRAIGPLVEAAGVRGWSLVSGGALGIDGAVHRAALDRGIGQLAVLPCGRDRLYPPRHVRMFAALVDSGSAGVLFAHPRGTEPAREMFASRNAIVVALADAVLVAEASLRSGSRSTGRLTLQRERALAALAGSPGCGALIGAGARALPRPPQDDDPEQLEQLVAALGSWLDELRGAPVARSPDASAWPEHLAWLQRHLAAAGPAGASVDLMPDAARAFVALSEAEMLGLACEAAPGRWVAVVS